MAVRASDKVTLAVLPSPSYVRQYYVLQGSALAAPALPTTNPPAAPWTTTEPTYTAGSTNTLYTVMLTAYGSVSFEYGPVQESSSYEAAKQAYNLAAAASAAAGSASDAAGAAQQTATAAFNNAATADGKATTAQSTADGKNKITFSTSNASGTAFNTGDLWFKKTGTLITGQWEFVSGAWAARTLDSAVIGNLNAGVISAGTLNAARIGANSLTVEKIAIGDFTNFVTDPKFTFGQMNLPGTRYPSTDVAVPAGAPSGFVLSLPGTYDMFSTAPVGGGFPVTGGDQFYVEAWVCHTGASTGGLALRVWTSSSNKTNGTGEAWAYPGLSVTTASAQDTWVKVSGVITVPATATQSGTTKPQNFGWAGLGTGGPTGTGWWIADWNLRRMSKGELIVDGAITAQKMVAGTITAASGIIADAAITTAKIANLAVDNAKIASLDAAKITTGYLAAGRIEASTIAATHIAAGAVTAEKLAADSVTANSILAGSITVNKLAVGALDAYLITGANIQTNAEQNRGLVLNSGGLTAYNSSGSVTASINSTTGAVTMSGLTATNANISGIINASGGTFTGSITAVGDITSGGTGRTLMLTSGTVRATENSTGSVANLGAASLSFTPGSSSAYGAQMSLSLDNAMGTSGGVNGIWFGTRAGNVRITNTGGLLTLSGASGVKIEHNGGESGGPRFSDYGESTITDADLMLKTGHYRGTGIVNTPTTSGWWWIEVNAHDTNWLVQNAYGYANAFEKTNYRRYRMNGGWSGWERMDGLTHVGGTAISAPTGQRPINAQLLTQSGLVTITTNGSGDGGFAFPASFPNGLQSISLTRYEAATGDTAHVVHSGITNKSQCFIRVYQSNGATLNNYGLQYIYHAIGW